MKIRLLLLLSLIVSGLSAQEFVAFSNSTSDLTNISGFTYNDCVVDMDGDGLDDVVRVTSNNLFIDFQSAGGGFEHKAFPMSFNNVPSWSIAAGDIDGNGYNDLCFGDGNAVSFVKANDDGTAYEEHAIPDYIFSQRSTFADIDNDGHLDAFVCHDIDLSHPYRNDGMGNLVEDQTLIETIDLPGNYAAIWTDYDNDGDIDLYLTKCRGGASPGDPARTNALYQNNGDGTFTEVGAIAGVDDNAQSWSTVFEDFDNDGDMDAFIVNHDFQNRFYLNNGDGTFTDIIDQTGINPNDLGAWENASGDFNNDGYMDIISELSNELYLNNGDLTFTGQDLPFSPGAIGDINDDGFLDVMAWGNLYTNNGNDNNFIKVNTQGVMSNANGIGARVEIHGDWGIQIREVRSGQSFAPMSSMQIHFGLGEATEVDLLVVKWPSGVVTTIENPEINTTISVLESGCLLPPSELVVNGETTICPGETVELVAPDGFDNITWSNGGSGQTLTVGEEGSYNAILTDTSGCVSVSNSVAVNVIVETPPSIEVSGSESFCVGDEVTLTATGGTDYTWSNQSTEESITVSESGIFSVSIIGECSGTPLESETVELTAVQAPTPITEPLLDVVAGTSITLMADGQGGEVHWYDAETDGVLLGIGDEYITPEIPWGGAYFYPESVHIAPGEEQSGGKVDFDGDGGLPGQGAYNLFNSWEPFVLKSVEIRLPLNGNEGTRTIQLVDASENVLEETTFDVVFGEQTLELNWNVPVGDGLSLRCVEGSLFRNSDGVDYPYAIGDVGEITTSFFGPNFYYYFYDWKIEVGGSTCISDRVTVFVDAFVSTQEELAEAGVSIFPNPAQSELFVEMKSTASFVRILDITGKEIIHQNVNGNETLKLDVSDFASGVYTIQMEVDGKVLNSKVIVE